MENLQGRERPSLAVGAVVVADGALLMVQRGRPPAQGLWTIPGGRVEYRERLETAVAREVKEETGLDVEVGRLLGVFEVLGDAHYVILDHEAIPKGDTTPRAGDDAVDVRWVPLTEVREMRCTPRLVEMLTAWHVLEDH